jgi:chromosome segregation ATPase
VRESEIVRTLSMLKGERDACESKVQALAQEVNASATHGKRPELPACPVDFARVRQDLQGSEDADEILEAARTHLWELLRSGAAGGGHLHEYDQLLASWYAYRTTARALRRAALDRDAAESRLVIANRELATARAAIETLEQRLSSRTSELRRLNDERNPSTIERGIKDAVAAATAKRDAEIADARATIATQKSEIDGLRASKKKLRDALERLKETK